MNTGPSARSADCGRVRLANEERHCGWCLRGRIRLKKPEFEDVLVLKGWVLIDGKELGLGMLLRRVTTPAAPVVAPMTSAAAAAPVQPAGESANCASAAPACVRPFEYGKWGHVCSQEEELLQEEEEGREPQDKERVTINPKERKLGEQDPAAARAAANSRALAALNTKGLLRWRRRRIRIPHCTGAL